MHGPQNTLLLLGLLALARPGRIGPRRAALTGVVLGLAMTVQLWQAVSFVVILWWVVVRRRQRMGSAAARRGLRRGHRSRLWHHLPAVPGRRIGGHDPVRGPRPDRPPEHRRGRDRTPPRARRLPAADAVAAGSPTAGARPDRPAGRRQRARVGPRDGTVLPVDTCLGGVALAQTGVVLATPSFYNSYRLHRAAATLVIGTGLTFVVSRLTAHGLRPVHGRVAIGFLFAPSP